MQKKIRGPTFKYQFPRSGPALFRGLPPRCPCVSYRRIMRKNSLAKRTAVIFVALALFSLPSFANAAITYMRSQLGPKVTTPFTITVSAESFSDYGLSEGVDLYYIKIGRAHV